MNKKPNPKEKVPHGFVARTIYRNTLPDLPFEPKFLEYQFDHNRFTNYNTTSLERQHKIELHVPRNLGIHIDLINPKAYAPRDINQDRLDPEDRQLIEDEISEEDKIREQIHKEQSIAFARSEILAIENKHYGRHGGVVAERQIGIGSKLRNDLHKSKMFAAGMTPGGTKLSQYGKGQMTKNDYNDLINSKSREKDNNEHITREQQIETIEKGFEAVKDVEKYHKHHSKKTAEAVAYLPVFPDFECWQYPCCQVVFHQDPAIPAKAGERRFTEEELSQALVRGMVDADHNQFVAYFMPTQATLEKRNIDAQACVNFDENETYDYELIKEYNWVVKNFANVSKNYEQNYFFSWRNDQVFYNVLDTKVRLTKRKKDYRPNQKDSTTKAVLAVKHRNLNDKEIVGQSSRFSTLTNEEEDDSDSDGSSSDSDGSKICSDDETVTTKKGKSTEAESTVQSTHDDISSTVTGQTFQTETENKTGVSESVMDDNESVTSKTNTFATTNATEAQDSDNESKTEVETNNQSPVQSSSDSDHFAAESDNEDDKTETNIQSTTNIQTPITDQKSKSSSSEASSDEEPDLQSTIQPSVTESAFQTPASEGQKIENESSSSDSSSSDSSSSDSD